jgi:cell division septation protein DedD
MRRIDSAGMSYTQVFLLVVGFGIASAIIFLFGMWVGRDVAERRLAQEERVVRQPVTAQPAAEEGREGDVDRAFYERLKDKAAQHIDDTPKVEPTPTVGAAASATANPALGATRPPTRTAVQSTPTIATPRPRLTATPRVASAGGDEWADAGWTVQVFATTDASAARDSVARLRAQGFEAYTVQAPQRGEMLYRIRVRRFSNKDRAKEMEQRLKSEAAIDGAFVTPQ